MSEELMAQHQQDLLRFDADYTEDFSRKEQAQRNFRMDELMQIAPAPEREDPQPEDPGVQIEEVRDFEGFSPEEQDKITRRLTAEAIRQSPLGGTVFGQALAGASEFGPPVAEDVREGAIQAPRRATRGVVNALNSAFEIGNDIDRLFNTPVLQVLDEQGTLDLRIMRARDVPEGREFKLPNLPEPERDTVTGNMIEVISEFMVGFKGVDKALKASKVAQGIEQGGRAGRLGMNIAKGAIADMAVFDAQEQRLSNLIQEVPQLQNPVTEFLAADPEDSTAEGKFKQAIEGLTLGAVGDVFGEAVILTKRGRAAREGLEQTIGQGDEAIEAAAKAELNKEVFAALGNVDTDDLILKTKRRVGQKAAKKLAQATKEVDPEQVARQTAEEFDISINFARIDGREDVKALMEQMANDPDLVASVKSARRGVRTDEELLRSAQDIDGFNTLMDRRVGQTLSDDQTLAARKLYYDTTDKLLEVAKEAADPDAGPLAQFKFRKMMAVHHAVQKEVLGARAEAARALRAWSIPVGGTDGGRIRHMEQVMEEFGGRTASHEMAVRLTMLGDDINTAQINKIVQKGSLARTSDALVEAWQLGLLTSPRTHTVNMISSYMTGLQLGGERFATALASDEVPIKEAVEYFNGFFGAHKRAMSAAAEGFRSRDVNIGLSKIDTPIIRSSAREILDPDGKAGMFSKAFDFYGDMLDRYAGGMMAAGDSFNKTVVAEAELRAGAAKEGVQRGLRGQDLKDHIAKVVDERPAELVEAAHEAANYATFTKELGKTGKSIQRFLGSTPGSSGRLIVPFARTPMNIFKFTFERTPLGLLSENIRADLAAGGRRGAMAATKIATGTMVMQIGTDLALDGHVTGGGPIDPKQRAALRRTGWQPYSIRTSEGNYVSYARMDPFATWLGMSADMAEILTNYEAYDVEMQAEVESTVTAMVVAMSNQVVGKTFMTGVSDLTQALADPERNMERYITRFGSSLVPRVISDIEKGINPEISQAYNFIDGIKSQTPLLSDSVAERRNTYGEPIKAFYPTGKTQLDEALIAAFNPYYFSEGGKSPLDEFFLSTGIHPPSMPMKSQRFSMTDSFGRPMSVAVNLRDFPTAYARLVELRGNNNGELNEDIGISVQYGGMPMKDFLIDMVNGDTMRSLEMFGFGTTQDDQSQLVSAVKGDYEEVAKRVLLDEFPELRQTLEEEAIRMEQNNEMRGDDGLIRTKRLP